MVRIDVPGYSENMRKEPHGQPTDSPTPLEGARTFEPTADQVGEARHFAGALLRSWGLEPDTTELVVSELATNASVHAKTPYRVNVSDGDGAIHVRVDDDNPVPPVMAAESDEATGGRGLRIVNQLSRVWGVALHQGDGKTVWAELKAAAK